jgi:putative transposase
MSPVEPVDPRIRLAIAQWPPEAPRGSVTTFCLEHSISRKTFYAIRKRALEEGQAAALEPRSRRPKNSPSTITEEAKKQAVGVRAALESSGLDHGPINVHDKMTALGMDAPSILSMARIFRETGVARAEPRKKPRAAYRRFVHPASNTCWQLDATEYVLVGGRKCVIFQLIDDHSRYAVASHAAIGETSRDAIRVVRKAIKAHGVPQRLLSDNGVALNPTRRGILGQLVVYVSRLGVEPITGKPYKPTTQGKNERFHQTLFRYLEKQPIAANLRELQAQVDAFDVIYNTERPHQALPGRITPLAAWEATTKADPPRPRPAPPRKPHQPPPSAPVPQGRIVEGIRVVTVHPNGSIKARGTTFNVS